MRRKKRQRRGGEKGEKAYRDDAKKKKRGEGGGGEGKGKKRSNTENEFIDLSEIEIIESLGG